MTDISNLPPQAPARPAARRTANRQANSVPQPPQAPPQVTPVVAKKVGVPAIKELLGKKFDAIRRVIPKNAPVTAEGLVQNALQQVVGDRQLALCPPVSVFLAVLACAQIGLDLIADQAYLIPHEMKRDDGQGGREFKEWHCALWPGYRGLITVAGRFGWFLDCQAIHANDEIEVRLGTDNKVTHYVDPLIDRGGVIASYSVVRDREKRVAHVEFVSKQDLDKIRQDTKPWSRYEGQMAMKTAAKRAFKWIPKDSAELKLMAEVENRLEEGQGLDDLFLPETDQPPTT